MVEMHIIRQQCRPLFTNSHNQKQEHRTQRTLIVRWAGLSTCNGKERIVVELSENLSYNVQLYVATVFLTFILRMETVMVHKISFLQIFSGIIVSVADNNTGNQQVERTQNLWRGQKATNLSKFLSDRCSDCLIIGILATSRPRQLK